MSATEVTPALPSTDDGDHERFAHWVADPAAVTRAYITGETVTALCGKTWVPTRDPTRYPICPTCVEIKRRKEAEERA